MPVRRATPPEQLAVHRQWELERPARLRDLPWAGKEKAPLLAGLFFFCAAMAQLTATSSDTTMLGNVERDYVDQVAVGILLQVGDDNFKIATDHTSAPGVPTAASITSWSVIPAGFSRVGTKGR
jgi:hypothetical protein